MILKGVEKAAFQASLTEADTVIVSAMCEQFFGLMSSENYDQAFAMISELDDENRLAYLSDDTKQGLKNRFSSFTIDKAEFSEEGLMPGNSDVLHVTYNTIARSGDFDKPVIITYHYNDSTMVDTVTVKGYVTPIDLE